MTALTVAATRTGAVIRNPQQEPSLRGIGLESCGRFAVVPEQCSRPLSNCGKNVTGTQIQRSASDVPLTKVMYPCLDVPTANAVHNLCEFFGPAALGP